MDAHRQKVRNLFSRIAGRYDRMNTIISLTLDRGWRERTLAIADPQPGEQWLDVCCGTGKLSIEIGRKLDSTGSVTGLDFTLAMLEVAKRAEMEASLPSPVCWIEGDATCLPFADGMFDGVTIGFGLRNLPDYDAGIREMFRVLKPGGRWICLELSHPVWPVFKQGHAFFVHYLVPFIGNLGLGEQSHYRWLPESLSQFPGADELAKKMRRCGLVNVRYERLSGGIAAVHSGYRPMDELKEGATTECNRQTRT